MSTAGKQRKEPERINLMRKALWLQLPQFKVPEPMARLEDELAHYQRLRCLARRTPERAEQARLYQTRVKAWLRLPENRWCRVYLLLLGRRAAWHPKVTITRDGVVCSCSMNRSGFRSIGKAIGGSMNIASGPGSSGSSARWAGTIHRFEGQEP